MAEQTNEDKMAAIPLSAPTDSKSTQSTPKPRWLQRQEYRQQYLSGLHDMRMMASPSPSPSPLPQDLARDTTSDPLRQANFTSTSLHSTEGAETYNRNPTLSSTSTNPHFSRHTKTHSLPSNTISRTSTINTSSTRTSASWLTCAERETASKHFEALDVGPLKMSSTSPTDGSEQSKKPNVFKVMLSAVGRKKMRELAHKNSSLSATQAPSTDDLLSPRPDCVYNPSRLESRGGAAERQDFREFRSFLDANPARPEDRTQSYEPRSEMVWDTDDDETEAKVSKFPRKHKQYKHSTKDHEYGKAEATGLGSEISESVSNLDGAGESHDVNGGAGTDEGSAANSPRELSSRDLSIAAGNAFAQEEARKKSRFRRAAEKLRISPGLTEATHTLYGSSSASASPSFGEPARGGLPAGSLSPRWDDTVKRIKKQVAEREAQETKEESKQQYSDTLRMLEGVTPVPTELVNPFERVAASEGDDTESSIGLGILSPAHEELATQNRLAANMSFKDFAAMKAEEVEPRNVQPSYGREQESPRLWTGQETITRRPMTTITEFSKETASSSSSDKTIRPGDKLNVSPSIYSTDDFENTDQSYSQTTQIKPKAPGKRYEEHRYYEDDEVSLYTTESTRESAIPSPLQIDKTRGKYPYPADLYTNELSSRPKHVPILHVSKSSQHLQPSESMSFIPRRDSEFRGMIQEQSRRQARKVRSHPALRAATDPAGTIAKPFASRDRNLRPETMATHARVDSDTGTSVGEVAGGGYRIGYGRGQQFASTKLYPTMPGVGGVRKDPFKRKPTPMVPDEFGDQQTLAHSKASAMTGGTAEVDKQTRQRTPTLVTFDEIGAQPATSVDLGALRREVGLAPAQMPVGLNSPKHPNHPFTWTHEKVMCYGVHNPSNAQPDVSGAPKEQLVSFGRLNTQHFSNSPAKIKIQGVKVCAVCGVHCCRFANLVVTSKMSTNNDITEENYRMKAEQRVDKLGAHHPSGIEGYDTFLECLHCKRKICPRCSIKCMERLCGAIICSDCAPASGVCPMHDSA